MDGQPIVSVIVVSYNQARFIRENLDSIKAQNYPNIELIVADDASSDNSVEVFEQWLAQNEYPAIRNYHTTNTGLATVLNECIALATGKYIKLIAADDYLHAEAIIKSVQKLEASGEDYGMVFTDIHTVDEHSNIKEVYLGDFELYHADANEFYDLLVMGNRISALSVVMRKSVLLETGFYDEKFIVEDYYRWLKIGQLYKIAYVPEKLAYYRHHGANISVLKEAKIKEEDILLKLMFDKTGVAKDTIRHYMIMELIRNKIFEGEIWEAYKQYPYRDKILESRKWSYLPSFGLKVLNKWLHFYGAKPK